MTKNVEIGEWGTEPLSATETACICHGINKIYQLLELFLEEWLDDAGEKHCLNVQMTSDVVTEKAMASLGGGWGWGGGG